jgi:tryptophan synthase alpha chain
VDGLQLSGSSQKSWCFSLYLVDRIRKVTDTPVAVGLGVSTREHAKEVAAYADGVIVGSAFINALSGADSLDSGIKAVRALVEQLALGVREGRG